MIYIKTQIKSLIRQINTLKIDFMEQELKEWLRARWKRDNIAKYCQYLRLVRKHDRVSKTLFCSTKEKYRKWFVN